MYEPPASGDIVNGDETLTSSVVGGHDTVVFRVRGSFAKSVSPGTTAKFTAAVASP
jgi:hypothetical protein